MSEAPICLLIKKQKKFSDAMQHYFGQIINWYTVMGAQLFASSAKLNVMQPSG